MVLMWRADFFPPFFLFVLIIRSSWVAVDVAGSGADGSVWIRPLCAHVPRQGLRLPPLARHAYCVT